MDARSYLFVPGDRPERFTKALDSGADAVVIDLEDAVAPAAKQAAREGLQRWLSTADPARLMVRVNAVGTPWHVDDVRHGARVRRFRDDAAEVGQRAATRRCRRAAAVADANRGAHRNRGGRGGDAGDCRRAVGHAARLRHGGFLRRCRHRRTRRRTGLRALADGDRIALRGPARADRRGDAGARRSRAPDRACGHCAALRLWRQAVHSSETGGPGQQRLRTRARTSAAGRRASWRLLASIRKGRSRWMANWSTGRSSSGRGGLRSSTRSSGDAVWCSPSQMVQSIPHRRTGDDNRARKRRIQIDDHIDRRSNRHRAQRNRDQRQRIAWRDQAET